MLLKSIGILIPHSKRLHSVVHLYPTGVAPPFQNLKIGNHTEARCSQIAVRDHTSEVRFADHNVASVDTLCERTTFGYGAVGRNITTMNANGKVSTTVYDIASQALASINPLGQRSTTIYNAGWQTQAVENALGYRTSFNSK
jgi:uncharacterized protein RhaS with RHS repeats